MSFSCFDTNFCLSDRRIKLEPLSWSHFQPLLPICLDQPDLIRYSATPFGTPDALMAYFELAMDQKATGYRYPFAIYDLVEKTYVGTTSFTELSTYDRRIHIGWTWISRSHHRCGINRHAKYLMLEHAFERMGIIRVAFRVDARNQRSRKALESLGATYEGEFRSDTLMSDGFRRNTVYYSILWEEWIEIKTARFARQLNASDEDLEEQPSV